MKTVKVRIAVAVDPSGHWNGYGNADALDTDALDQARQLVGEGEARYWLTAELPVPEAQEIAATVEEANP